MEIPLYKIEEESTTGWEIVKVFLTKQECTEEYTKLLNDGISPKRIKISRVS
tara:strand:- start:393 stop:548 length:156 start_codon:yes stop_codon:yes gene_type:complete